MKIINSATEIMMDVFIDVLVDDKLELLVIEGQPELEDLQAAWDKIFSEYLDALGDPTQREVMSIVKDINVMMWQYKRVETLIEILSVYYVKDGVMELRRMGYRVRYDENDLNTYYRDLNAAYSRAKNLLVNIEVRQKELDKVMAKKKGDAASRSEFQSMLVGLSIHAKYQVDPTKLTAYQFAVMIKQRNDFAEKAEKALTKQRKWQKN